MQLQTSLIACARADTWIICRGPPVHVLLLTCPLSGALQVSQPAVVCSLVTLLQLTAHATIMVWRMRLVPGNEQEPHSRCRSPKLPCAEHMVLAVLPNFGHHIGGIKLWYLAPRPEVHVLPT